MTSSPLHAAVVLRPGAASCEVLSAAGPAVVGYAAPFASRAAELVPGHLLAIATAPDGTRLAVWRWYDAVVLGAEDGRVRVWEPGHGEVLATPRHPGREHPVGSRAYASAGLPGADWWLAGPAGGPVAEADVELAAVDRFYADHGLWDRLA